MFTTPYALCIKCHMSYVTCHLSCVTCQILFVICNFFGVEASRWRVRYQWGLFRLVFIFIVWMFSHHLWVDVLRSILCTLVTKKYFKNLYSQENCSHMAGTILGPAPVLVLGVTNGSKFLFTC